LGFQHVDIHVHVSNTDDILTKEINIVCRSAVCIKYSIIETKEANAEQETR
jgi:hypothetical protein